MKTSEIDVENKIDSVNADLLKDLRTSSEYSELASVRVFLIFKNKKPSYSKDKHRCLSLEYEGQFFVSRHEGFISQNSI